MADRAGLKLNDIVYEFAACSIDRATDLGVAVDSMSSGDQSVIKLHRNGGKDMIVTVHFLKLDLCQAASVPLGIVDAVDQGILKNDQLLGWDRERRNGAFGADVHILNAVSPATT